MFGAILKTLRPHQWVKNAFVLAPLVFAKQLTDANSAMFALLAAACFCAVSGAVYALNDVIDVEGDRAHPEKRNRPIASGALSIRAALVLSATLAIGALAVAYPIAPAFSAVVFAYLLVNTAYSLKLKQVPYLDVTLIASGFALRVLGGAYAIDVPPSHWLIVCTVLLAAYLGLGKRFHEFEVAHRLEGAMGETRSVLRKYRRAPLRMIFVSLAFLTTAAYVAYTQAPQTVAFFGTRMLAVTTPFCAIGIFRFYQLAHDPERPKSPSDAMLRDKLFMANILVWGAAVLLSVYIA